MILSMVLVLQLRTESKIRATLPTRQVTELAKMFNSQKVLLEKYEQDNQYLRSQLKDYDRDQEVARLQMLAGLTAVRGKGLRILLSDRSSKNKLKVFEDPALAIVHYDQLELLVNELRAAGAEAIAVNGYRIGSNTGFGCAGNTILVDTKRIAPPYRIEAIGDPLNLKSALMMPGGFVENQIVSFDLRFEIEISDLLQLPPYHSIAFEYAKPFKETKQKGKKQ